MTLPQKYIKITQTVSIFTKEVLRSRNSSPYKSFSGIIESFSDSDDNHSSDISYDTRIPEIPESNLLQDSKPGNDFDLMYSEHIP